MQGRELNTISRILFVRGYSSPLYAHFTYFSVSLLLRRMSQSSFWLLPSTDFLSNGTMFCRAKHNIKILSTCTLLKILQSNAGVSIKTVIMRQTCHSLQPMPKKERRTFTNFVANTCIFYIFHQIEGNSIDIQNKMCIWSCTFPTMRTKLFMKKIVDKIFEK